jgi:hypothetical protein
MYENFDKIQGKMKLFCTFTRIPHRALVVRCLGFGLTVVKV